MLNDKIRIGIIGAGGIANAVHLPSAASIEGCEIAAVCDLVESRARAAAEKYNIPHVYRWHQDMLEHERLDGIFCLVQCDLMYRVAYDCLTAGNNILMEKPAGITLYQTESLARTAEKTGKIAAVAMNRRHIPLVQFVIKTMRELTEITQVDGCFYKYSDVASGWHYAPAFVCDIIHAADLVRYIAGAEPARAASVIGRFGSPCDNAWSAVISFENGATGTLRSNYSTAARMHNFEIHGPRASAYINLGMPGTKGCDAVLIHSAGRSIYSQAAAGTGVQRVEHIDGIELAGGNEYLWGHYGYLQEDIDFIDAIRAGRQPLCTVKDAVGSMKLIEMLLNSKIN